MYKKIFILIFWCSFSVCLQAQNTSPNQIDSVAVSILDKMSALIGDLRACRVSIHSDYDIRDKDLGLVKHSDEAQLLIHGPNKLFAKYGGDKGARDFFYDGNTFSYYSVDNNQYGQLALSPGTGVVEMMDTIHKAYGILFPGADFFYPTFVDDIIADARYLVYLGLTNVDGKQCFHIAGTGKDKTYQFWISDDVYFLPVKMVIVDSGKELNPQYEAHFSNWELNPILPDALFNFTAPPKSTKIKIVKQQRPQ